MTQPRTIEGREHTKFVESPTRPNESAIEVTIGQGLGDTVKVEFDDAGISINTYNEILSLGGLASDDLVLFTVPVGKILKLQRIDFSGSNKAIYKIDINGSVQAKKRTWYTKYNDHILFNNLVLVAGDVVKLIVENKTNSVADFNGNLQGKLDNA